MTQQGLEYIAKTYDVPAEKGQRVVYHPIGRPRRPGKISGAWGQYIHIHFDGEEKPSSLCYHPTWAIAYLDENDKPIEGKDFIETETKS